MKFKEKSCRRSNRVKRMKDEVRVSFFAPSGFYGRKVRVSPFNTPESQSFQIVSLEVGCVY